MTWRRMEGLEKKETKPKKRQTEKMLYMERQEKLLVNGKDLKHK